MCKGCNTTLHKQLTILIMKEYKMDTSLLLDLLKTIVTNDKIQATESAPFVVGRTYFIRTVTYHLVGRVEKIVGNFLVLERETASWIADSGRFTQAIDNGDLNEVEPVETKCYVNISSIVDVFDWVHKLPREQK